MTTQELQQLIHLAKFAGGRFDLVQAGGGNISWKSKNNEIFIKKSGISMSEIVSVNQCARLHTQEVFAILNNQTLLNETSKKAREETAEKLLAKTNLTPDIRPSIEVYLHVMLFAFTLHTHPIAVNNLVIRKDAKDIVESLFPDSVFVDYATPGIELAIALKEAVSRYETKNKRQPHLIFLKNHGLIVSANHVEEVEQLTDAVVTKIEQTLQISYERYRLASRIAALFQKITGSHEIAYLSEDQQILQIRREHPALLEVWPTSPDAFVFNGFVPCKLTALSEEELLQYQEMYVILPKVVIYQDNLFFIHQSVRKTKEMEDVYKFHLMALCNAQGEVESLPREELLYLADWEAEKFRQKQ